MYSYSSVRGPTYPRCRYAGTGTVEIGTLFDSQQGSCRAVAAHASPGDTFSGWSTRLSTCTSGGPSYRYKLQAHPSRTRDLMGADEIRLVLMYLGTLGPSRYVHAPAPAPAHGWMRLTCSQPKSSPGVRSTPAGAQPSRRGAERASGWAQAAASPWGSQVVVRRHLRQVCSSRPFRRSVRFSGESPPIQCSRSTSTRTRP